MALYGRLLRTPDDGLPGALAIVYHRPYFRASGASEAERVSPLRRVEWRGFVDESCDRAARA